MKPVYVLALSSLALTACSKPIELSPAVEQSGVLVSGIDFVHDAGAGTIVVTAPTGTATLSRVSSSEEVSALLFSDPGVSDVYAALAISESGAGNALMLTGISELSGIIVSRTEDTDMPTAGSASFAGDYTGFLVYPVNHVPASFSSGQVSLQADFGDMTIEGLITDRAIGFAPEFDIEDVELAKTVITNTGSFAGATDGGAIIGPGTSSESGTYSGLIVGSNGQEVVGGILLTHTIGSDTYEEIGVFEASE